MVPILYRWWDADGRLLYVGKSISLFARISDHRRNSAFFPRASTMTLERFESPEALSAAEVKAIRAEKPLYNIQHSAGRGGDSARVITVLDGPPPALPEMDASTGYWSRIEAGEIGYSDIIRFANESGEVGVQGLIDDDHFPGDDDEDADECEFDWRDKGWYVITDDGTEEVVTNFEIETLYPCLFRWTCVNPDDPYRDAICSNWYDLLARTREVS